MRQACADQLIGSRVTLFGRYNHAPSNSVARLFALSNPTNTIVNTDTLTAGATAIFTPHLNNDLRFNYSHTTGETYSWLDNFGGAVPFDESTFFPSFASPSNSFGGLFLDGGIDSNFYLGRNVLNSQRQYNVVETVSFVTGTHQFKFGGDYRRVATLNNPQVYSLFAYFAAAASAVGGHTTLTTIQAQNPINVYFNNLSAFAQDAWKVTPRLTVTYGLRWELNPAPYGSQSLYTFQNPGAPVNLTPATAGTPLYKTTWANFAPRLGVAYLLDPRSGHEQHYAAVSECSTISGRALSARRLPGGRISGRKTSFRARSSLCPIAKPKPRRFPCSLPLNPFMAR